MRSLAHQIAKNRRDTESYHQNWVFTGRHTTQWPNLRLMMVLIDPWETYWAETSWKNINPANNL